MYEVDVFEEIVDCFLQKGIGFLTVFLIGFLIGFFDWIFDCFFIRFLIGSWNFCIVEYTFLGMATWNIVFKAGLATHGFLELV